MRQKRLISDQDELEQCYDMNSPTKLVNSLAAAPRERLETGTQLPERRFSVQSQIWFAPALAAALVAIIGLWLASTLNIWIDEAYTIHTTGSGVAYALQQATTFELQPPLYFLLISAWRLIDESSVAFARFPSIIFAAAATALIVITARRLAPRLPPVALAFAVALNPIVIWAAVEMRVYSLVLLIAAALTWSFVDGFLVPRPWRFAQVCYAVAGIAGLYAQFYLGFVLLAFAIIVVAARRAILVPFIVANAVIALAFLPFVPTVLQELGNAGGGDVRRVSLLKALHEMLNANFIYALPHEIGWSGPTKIVGFLVAAALVAALAFIGRPSLDRCAASIAGSLLVASLIFSVMFAVVGEVPDIRRHAIAIAPLTLLTAFAVLSGLQARRRPLLTATVVCYCVFGAASLWWAYKPPISKTGDWQRVATTVTTRQPNAPVIIFPPSLALAIGRYLPSGTHLIPFPRPMTFSINYLNEMKLQDEAQVARAFAQDRIRAAPFWIVSDNSCDPGPQVYDFSCGYLTSYLRAHYTAASSYKFHGAVATLYDRSIATP